MSVKEEKITFLNLIIDPKIGILYFLVAISTVLVLFLDPTFGPYLVTEYSLAEFEVGLLFSVSSFTYLGFSPLVLRIQSRMKNKALLIYIGTVLMGISFLLFSPDRYMGLKNGRLYLVILA